MKKKMTSQVKKQVISSPQIVLKSKVRIIVVSIKVNLDRLIIITQLHLVELLQLEIGLLYFLKEVGRSREKLEVETIATLVNPLQLDLS